MNLKRLELENWTQAFEQLHQLCMTKEKGRKKVILLDEISWMGMGDPDFAGYLKDVWDRLLCNDSDLIFILCGSVSSWIQKNILHNTGFVGRVSKEIVLRELSISESYLLLKKSSPRISSLEVAQILSVVGGVPKYLEEFAPFKNTSAAIRELALHSSGFLFREFEQIFSDIFGKNIRLHEQILVELSSSPLSSKDVAEKMRHPLNGDWSQVVFDLEQAGFVRKYYTWNLASEASRLSRLFICDNYIRFYIKFVKPRKHALEERPVKTAESLEVLPWNTIFGLQFESMILNNIDTLLSLAEIPVADVLRVGPFFQNPTRLQRGVQIDCLVQCKKGILHLFEIKSGPALGLSVVRDVEEKVRRFKIPKGFAIRHYLVCLGDVSEELVECGFFDKIIPFEKFLR
jgi:hypothetical protein